MKLLKVFAAFIVLHVMAWGAAHWYLSQHPAESLLVVDTSYSMKPKFPEMGEWIEKYHAKARYKAVTVGTDKAVLGQLSELKSYSVIFRTSFGRMTEASLDQYRNIVATEKVLLSDGMIQPDGWKVVKF